jgi:hypothetical protein
VTKLTANKMLTPQLLEGSGDGSYPLLHKILRMSRHSRTQKQRTHTHTRLAIATGACLFQEKGTRNDGTKEGDEKQAKSGRVSTVSGHLLLVVLRHLVENE